MYNYVCLCVTVGTGTCVGQLCVGCTAAYIDMYKSQGPLEHRTKGYGVHREPQLPDCIRHGLPTQVLYS